MTTEPTLFDEPDVPVEPAALGLPYGGTSGWAGSTTSLERAARDDAAETTTARQREVFRLLHQAREVGLTVAELRTATGWHHGRASGALSVLHKEGRIARLTHRRQRCEIYVLREHVGGRETATQGRRRHPLTYAQALTVENTRQAVDVVDAEHGRITVPASAVNVLLDLIAQAYDTTRPEEPPAP